MRPLKHVTIAVIVLGFLHGCASGRSEEEFEARVSKLVDHTTKSATAEQTAFRELEAFGPRVVPYLVGHLGDMRPLAENKISFESRASDTFEGVRHYSPGTVHDALAAILNAITGQSFVFVYNGATGAEREKNRRSWIEWCRATYPDQADVCSGE